MQMAAIMAGEVEPANPLTRDAMTRATRLITPFGNDAASMVELVCASASWSIFVDGSDDPLPTPRFRSIRRRGRTPDYPRPARFESMPHGSIILFPNGLVLEPEDRRHPCMNIAESTIRAASFYRDAFEVVIGDRERLLVRTEPVEHIDSVFQAYFWNPLP